MTIRYVGKGGNDANDGLSWATRKLTIDAVENTPVVKGDTVYIGPGTYRESLTCDVSGEAGNVITYIGDYSGAHTDGVGGVVRITGSDNDQTAARANLINANGINYRSFQCIVFDMWSAAGYGVQVIGTSSGWIIENCIFGAGANSAQLRMYTNGTNNTVRGCLFQNEHGGSSSSCIDIGYGSTVDNAGTLVENCLLLGGNYGVRSIRVGGITVRNCTLRNMGRYGISVGAALSLTATPITVNNCILCGISITAIVGFASAEITEDYNALFGNAADRANVNTGAHSAEIPALFDPRWFLEMVQGGKLVSTYDLANYSPLINLGGNNPPVTDARGTGIIGAARELGALEYDSSLEVSAGSGGTGGAVRIVPLGRVGL